MVPTLLDVVNDHSSILPLGAAGVLLCVVVDVKIERESLIAAHEALIAIG